MAVYVNIQIKTYLIYQNSLMEKQHNHKVNGLTDFSKLTSFLTMIKIKKKKATFNLIHCKRWILVDIPAEIRKILFNPLVLKST